MLGLGLRGLGLGGMAGAGLLRLPRYVIETPATTLLDFESAAAWTAVTITAADNRTEKVQGSQSVKLTTAAGGNGHITRTFAPCQLFPSTNFLRLRIYLHSAPETVAGACIVILCEQRGKFDEVLHAAVAENRAGSGGVGNVGHWQGKGMGGNGWGEWRTTCSMRGYACMRKWDRSWRLVSTGWNMGRRRILPVWCVLMTRMPVWAPMRCR